MIYRGTGRQKALVTSDPSPETPFHIDQVDEKIILEATHRF
jgi:hypothetical protein